MEQTTVSGPLQPNSWRFPFLLFFFLFSPSRFRSSTLALSRLTDLLTLELLSFPILSPSTFKLHGHFSFLQNCLVRRRMCKELGLWKKMERAKLVETSRLNRPGRPIKSCEERCIFLKSFVSSAFPLFPFFFVYFVFTVLSVSATSQESRKRENR